MGNEEKKTYTTSSSSPLLCRTKARISAHTHPTPPLKTMITINANKTEKYTSVSRKFYTPNKTTTHTLEIVQREKEITTLDITLIVVEVTAVRHTEKLRELEILHECVLMGFIFIIHF